MAQRSPLSRELFFYALIFALAFLLRLAGLGEVQLNEFEASAALPAHQLTQGASPALGAQPAYVLLTSLLFSLFGSSEFAARLFPALFGLALVALPYFWRDQLGQKAALVLALILAIDPGLIAMSRLASGTILATGSGLVAVTAWRNRRPALAGVFVALALLSSPTIYYAIGAAALTWGALGLKVKFDPGAVRAGLVAAVVTLVLGGSLLFTVPQGLAGAGEVLGAFLGGVPLFPGASFFSTLLALVGYALPALIFGGLAAVRAWRQGENFSKTLSMFAVIIIMLVLLNPNHQIADLLWALLPLWVLTAQHVSRYLQSPNDEPIAAIGEALLMLLLAAFLLPTLARVAATGFFFPADPATQQLSSLTPNGTVALFVLAIAVLATALIAFGWSKSSAAQGLVWAAALIAAFFLLSAGSRALRHGTASANELWSPGPAAGTLDLMLASLEDFSFWDQGQKQALAVDVRSDSAALNWALRNYPRPESGGANPMLAISSADEANSAKFAGYRGQSFALNVQRTWDGWPGSFFGWFLFREAPTQTEQIILWASADLFLDRVVGEDVPEGALP